MDIFDQATEREEHDRALALKAARNKAPVLTPNGQCFNCAETIKTGCFCDADCRDDWQARNGAM